MTFDSQYTVKVLSKVPWIGREGVKKAKLSYLGAGEYNYVIHVQLFGKEFALRLPKPDSVSKGGDYLYEFYNLTWANFSGLGPKIRYFDYEEGILLMDYFPGKSLTEQQLTDEMLIGLGERFHQIHRLPEFQYKYDLVGRKIDKLWPKFLKMPQGVRSKLIVLKSPVDEARQLLRLTAPEFRPCHNDLRGPNILVNGEDVLIIDWEHSSMGDPDIDLAFFAHYMELQDAQIMSLSSGYGGERPEELRIARIHVARPVISTYFALRQANLYRGAKKSKAQDKYLSRAFEAIENTWGYLNSSGYKNAVQILSGSAIIP